MSTREVEGVLARADGLEEANVYGVPVPGEAVPGWHSRAAVGPLRAGTQGDRCPYPRMRGQGGHGRREAGRGQDARRARPVPSRAGIAAFLRGASLHPHPGELGREGAGRARLLESPPPPPRAGQPGADQHLQARQVAAGARGLRRGRRGRPPVRAGPPGAGLQPADARRLPGRVRRELAALTAQPAQGPPAREAAACPGLGEGI